MPFSFKTAPHTQGTNALLAYDINIACEGNQCFLGVRQQVRAAKTLCS